MAGFVKVYEIRTGEKHGHFSASLKSALQSMYYNPATCTIYEVSIEYSENLERVAQLYAACLEGRGYQAKIERVVGPREDVK